MFLASARSDWKAAVQHLEAVEFSSLWGRHGDGKFVLEDGEAEIGRNIC